MYNRYSSGNLIGCFTDITQVRKHAKEVGVSSIYIVKRDRNIGGTLDINYNDNTSCKINYKDYKELLDFVARFRNAYGSLIYFNNEPKGLLSIGNYFIESERNP